MSSKINSLLIFAATVIVLAGYSWVIIPKMGQARTLAGQINDQKTQAAVLRTKYQMVQAVSAALAKDTSKSQLLTLAVPPDADLTGIFIALDNLAASAKVTLSAITPDQSSSKTGVKVTIAASGDYANLKSFLNGLNANLRPVILETATISSSSTSSTSTNSPANNASSDQKTNPVQASIAVTFVSAPPATASNQAATGAAATGGATSETTNGTSTGSVQGGINQ